MNHKLTFNWIGGNTSAADHMKKTFNAAGIPWRYGSFFNLQAALNGSDYVNVEYYQISGNLFGITEKPPRASKYFGVPSEELYQEKPNADGYFREELKALDRTEEPGQFMTNGLLSALEMADYYRRAGYESVDIVQSIQDQRRFFVLCRYYNPALRSL